MTQATELAFAPRRADDIRLIAGVSAAHFVSHYYTLILAPLFAFVRADYGVTYTELGIALAAYNLVSGALQTPAGFLVDRIGARNVLGAATLILADTPDNAVFMGQATEMSRVPSNRLRSI